MPAKLSPIQVCSATRSRLKTIRRVIRRPVIELAAYVQMRRPSPN